jgi:hypothetical protein
MNLAYNTKELLTDLHGKPIPQYYDPTTDAFLPMTKEVIVSISQTSGENLVSLSGSNIINVFAITPDDDNDLAHTTTAIYVGVEGDLKVDLSGVGTGITLKGLASGVWHPISVTKVYATGITATDILGAY